MDVSLGRCIVDSVAAFNLFADKLTTPLAPAYEEEYGADFAGGSETLRYYVQGSYSGEQGVYKVPAFDIPRMLVKNNGVIPGAQLRPNALTRATGRANMNLQLSPLADIAISTAFISSSQRLPQTENNTTGLTSSAYGGPGYKTNGFISGTTLPLMGYRAFTPGDMFQETVKQDIAQEGNPFSRVRNCLYAGLTQGCIVPCRPIKQPGHHENDRESVESACQIIE